MRKVFLTALMTAIAATVLSFPPVGFAGT